MANKVADRPHAITIALSLLAAGISAIGLYINYHRESGPLVSSQQRPIKRLQPEGPAQEVRTLPQEVVAGEEQTNKEVTDSRRNVNPASPPVGAITTPKPPNSVELDAAMKNAREYGKKATAFINSLGLPDADRGLEEAKKAILGTWTCSSQTWWTGNLITFYPDGALNTDNDKFIASYRLVNPEHLQLTILVSTIDYDINLKGSNQYLHYSPTKELKDKGEVDQTCIRAPQSNGTSRR